MCVRAHTAYVHSTIQFSTQQCRKWPEPEKRIMYSNQATFFFYLLEQLELLGRRAVRHYMDLPHNRIVTPSNTQIHNIARTSRFGQPFDVHIHCSVCVMCLFFFVTIEKHWWLHADGPNVHAHIWAAKWSHVVHNGANKPNIYIWYHTRTTNRSNATFMHRMETECVCLCLCMYGRRMKQHKEMTMTMMMMKWRRQR